MSAHDTEPQLGVWPANDTPRRRTVRLGLIASMVLLAGGLLLAGLSGTAAAQEATTVTVVAQPQETVAGEPINGSPTVMVTDDLGVPVPSAEIRVIVAEGPEGFASGSTIEYTDTNGEIAFDDLVLDEPGSYRLEFRATSGTATPATTDAFDVVADPNSIQAMVDAADPGDTVAIDPGTYVENVSVGTENLTIEAAAAERPHVEGGFAIFADGVTIRGLNISRGLGNGPGVSIRADGATVSGTEISETGTWGIIVDGDDATVIGSEIRDTGSGGIAAGTRGFLDGTLTIAESDIRDTGRAGIDVSQTGAVSLTDLTIRNTSRAGIEVRNPHLLTVSETSVRDTGGAGLLIDSPRDWERGTVDVSGLTVQNGTRGIEVFRVASVSLTDVTTRETRWEGFDVTARNITVDGVDVQGTEPFLSSYGLELVGSNVTVDTARIRDTGDDGARIRGSTLTVTAIDIRNTGSNGVDIAESGTVSIENATVHGTTGSGVVANGTDSVTIAGSTTTGAGEHGIRVVNASTAVVSETVVREATESGVFVNDADEATITGVDVDAAGVDGILVTQSGDVRVEASTVRNATRHGLTVGSSTTLAAVETVVQDSSRDAVSLRFVGAATLSGMEVRNARFAGVTVEDTDVITVADSVIVDSGIGVSLEDDSPTTLTGNHIANNSVGVRNDDPFRRTTIDATGNWWGASDGPGGDGPGHGDPVRGDVDFDPFLTITTVDTFEIDAEMAGVVHDDRDVPVTASGLATDEFEVESGVALLEVAGQTVPVEIVDGEVDTTINASAHLAPTTETGLVTADLEGVRQDDLRLVHEAYDLEAGYTRWSIPQPAALYTTDGVTDITQWRNDAAAYDDAGFATDDGSIVTDGGDLHRGMFVHAETDGERLGYDFATPGEASLPPGGAEPIGVGWNLLGSNYDVSSNDNLTLNHDLATVTNLPATAGDYTGEDDVVAFDPRSYNRLGGTHAVGPYETYWVYVDVGHPTEFRAITAPEYDPADGE